MYSIIQALLCLKVAPEDVWKDNIVFYKSKNYLNCLYKYWRSQKAFSSTKKKNSMTRYILTVETHSINLWIRAIPGQIILVKQISIHVYSIEKVREFDQKIPQSQIVDKPTAPWEELQDIYSQKSKATSYLFLVRMIVKLERT